MAKIPDLKPIVSIMGTAMKAAGGALKKFKNKRLTKKSVNEKLEKYLLNADHPVGKHKAKWFKGALGFDKNNMTKLSKQIKFDPKKAVQTDVTKYGTKFNQVIPIKGANGKSIDVTFAWIKNNDGVTRLVTAIPPK